MVSPSREKIALVIFVLLILAGLGLLVAYLNIGHNWNVTASQIDNATGELEGYTVILYSGQQPLEEREAAIAQAEASEKPSIPLFTLPQTDDISSNTSHETGDTSVHNEQSAQANGVTTGEVKNDHHDLDTNATSGQLNQLDESTQGESITLEQVQQSYKDKQATVFTLTSEDTARYRDGLILKQGSHRFGVLSVDTSESTLHIQEKVNELKATEVSFIILLTPERRLIEHVEGVDVVVSLNTETLNYFGETLEGTFYVDAPEKGVVGALIISPHNVVSSRDVRTL